VSDLPNVNQIRIPKTAEVLASRIRKRIIRGELKHGDKLPAEAVLIAEFEVSRPTLREAMRILEWEGLISVSRGARGGARVNAGTSDLVTRAAGLALQARSATIFDIYEARSLIEPHAARLAAELRPREAAGALAAQLAVEWVSITEHATMARAVAEFHRLLLDQCGNVTLAVVGQALQAVVERHLDLSYRQDHPTMDRKTLGKQVKLGFRSQEKLVELIAAGDGVGAERHWEQHMAAAGKVILKSVAKTAVIDILD
jgi:DNA-binding FadR family transcriptional regulator